MNWSNIYFDNVYFKQSFLA